MFNYKDLEKHKRYMVKHRVKCIIFKNGYHLVINFEYRDFDLVRVSWNKRLKKSVTEKIAVSHSSYKKFANDVKIYFEGGTKMKLGDDKNLTELDKTKIKEIEEEREYSNCSKCNNCFKYEKDMTIAFCIVHEEYIDENMLNKDLSGNEACEDFE